MKKRLGEILLEAGIINESQLQQALEYQQMWGQRLGSALVAKGFISEEMLMRVLGSTLNMPIVDISRIRIAPDVIKAVPARLAEKYDLIPIALESKGGGRQTLIIAMADPLNIEAVDQLKFTTGYNVRPVLSTISGIAEALRKYYGANSASKSVAKSSTTDAQMTLIQRGGGERTIDLSAEASSAGADEMQIQRPPGAERPRAPAPSNSTPAPVSPSAPPANAATNRRPPTGLTLSGLEGTEARDEVRALVRLMIKKGVFTKDEFLKELQEVMLY